MKLFNKTQKQLSALMLIYTISIFNTPSLYWKPEEGLGSHIIDLASTLFWGEKLKQAVKVPAYPSSLLKHVTDKEYHFGKQYLTMQSDNRRNSTSPADRFSTFLKHILPYLNLPQKNVTADLVIHIRSGDIWQTDGSGPHWTDKEKFLRDYTQPPLAYYSYILKKHINQIQSILIITDAKTKSAPTLEPLITLLDQYGKDVTIQQDTKENDFATIAYAPKFLVTSASNFSLTAGLCNYYLMPDCVQYVVGFVDEQKSPYWFSPLCHEIGYTNLPFPNAKIKRIAIGGDFGKKVLSWTSKGHVVSKEEAFDLYHDSTIVNVYEIA